MKKIKNTIEKFTSLEGVMFRYALSYGILYALLPTLIILLYLLQNHFIDINIFLSFLYLYVPSDLIQPFVDYMLDTSDVSFWYLVFTVIPSMFLASRSLYSFLLISASHEQFESRNFILRMKSFFLFLYFVMGSNIFLMLIHLSLFDTFTTFMIGLFIGLYYLYRSLSFVKREWYFGLPGALTSTFLMTGGGLLFLKLIDVFTSYKSVYGPLASLVILLLGIYIISSIIYFGYCLNLEYSFSKGKRQYKMMWFYRFMKRMEIYLKNKKR